MAAQNIKNIALFGGSFDPVTNAHKDIAQKLSERFDKVILMPTFVSPFKTGSAPSADGDMRVQMLKKAVRGLDGVTVSRYEINRGGISYTADTVAHLKKKYGCDDIHVVIGSEELPFLDKWHNAEMLKESVSFYVVERLGFTLDTETALTMADGGWKVRIAPFGVGDASSAQVKIERAFGGEKLPVPKSVAKYILKNSLYGDYKYITDRYEEFGLKKERIAHTKRVALCAVKLAKRFGVCVSDALTASLLHDIGKETDAEMLKRDGLPVPDGIDCMPEKIRHAAVGAVIAEHKFGVQDKEILDAVRLHTTGDKAMSPLAMTVFLADCAEEGREYDGAEKVRIAVRESLEKGMEVALSREIEHLKADGGEIYPLTVKAYNYYKKLDKKGKPSVKTASEKPKKTVQKQSAPEKEKDAKQEKTVKSENKKEDKKEKTVDETATVKAPEHEKPKPESDKTKELSHALAREIGGYLSEKRATDIDLIDVADRTVITDYFVIASASSATQVRALADYVDEKLSKGKGLEPLHRDSNPQWYAVDYGNVIVHIFLKSVREVYCLERLWSDGDNIERIED